MKTFQLCLAVLVLGAVLASAASDRQTNTDRATTASKSNAAEAADYYAHKNVRQLCLRELKQYNCRYVGCPNITDCNDNCFDCQQHAVGQSDVGCCPQKPSEYAQEDLSNVLTSDRVGVCDWDMDIFVCPASSGKRRQATPGKKADPTIASPQVNCVDPIPMDNGAYQIGTAWGTCVLNADSESCGHPFCDKMTLSFQGGVYAMTAYAKAPYSQPEYDVDAPTWQGCYPLGNIVPARKGGSPAAAQAEPLATGLKLKSSKHAAALQKAVESTGLLKKLQARHAKHNKNAKLRGPAATTWEEGLAVVVTGPVTVTSLKQKVEYDSGMLQYVPSWIGLPLEEGEPGSTAMVVTPFTYDISLSKAGGYDVEH